MKKLPCPGLLGPVCGNCPLYGPGLTTPPPPPIATAETEVTPGGAVHWNVQGLLIAQVKTMSYKTGGGLGGSGVGGEDDGGAGSGEVGLGGGGDDAMGEGGEGDAIGGGGDATTTLIGHAGSEAVAFLESVTENTTGEATGAYANESVKTAACTVSACLVKGWAWRLVCKTAPGNARKVPDDISA